MIKINLFVTLMISLKSNYWQPSIGKNHGWFWNNLVIQFEDVLWEFLYSIISTTSINVLMLDRHAFLLYLNERPLLLD